MNEGWTQRVYTPRGTVAHLVGANESLNETTPTALCGTAPGWPYVWLGTGCQAEHDRKAALRLCRKCQDQLDRDLRRQQLVARALREREEARGRDLEQPSQ